MREKPQSRFLETCNAGGLNECDCMFISLKLFKGIGIQIASDFNEQCLQITLITDPISSQTSKVTRR